MPKISETLTCITWLRKYTTLEPLTKPRPNPKPDNIAVGNVVGREGEQGVVCFKVMRK